MTFLRPGAWWGLNRGHPRHPRHSRREEEERPGAVSPGGHQHRPGQGYGGADQASHLHSLGDSLGVLDKQIFRCFVKHVDNILENIPVID